MKLAQLVLGSLQENCFLGVDEASGEGFVVDPGVPVPELKQYLTELGVTHLNYILLTHGHYDHVTGVNAVKSLFPEATIVCGEQEKEFINDPDRRGTVYAETYGFETILVDTLVNDNDSLPFADTEIRVVTTPGHTPGGVCYLIGDVMFSGDTLFCKTYGRTDFPGGSMEQMKASLEKLGNLEGNYNVLPGHGPATTLDYEREHNRYMRKLTWS